MDRITILELKIEAASRKDLNPRKFQAEKASLEQALDNWKGLLKQDFADPNKYTIRLFEIGQAVNGLAAINALLWVTEDRVRELSETEEHELAILCKRVAGLNDQRAEFVAEISKLYNDKDAGGEKIYGAKLSKETTPVG